MGATDDELQIPKNMCTHWGWRCNFKDFEMEKPQHDVDVPSFQIAKYETTNDQYRQCVNAGLCSPPADQTYFDDPQYGNHPVVFVSWDDANTFCQWLGMRLPTEAEWEKAARGSDRRIWPWGNNWDIWNLNCWDCGKQPRSTLPVGSQSKPSPYGALDMAGNVWEWTADWYGYYMHQPQHTEKVIRGGSWMSLAPDTRTTRRGHVPPNTRNGEIGFRCAK